MKISDRLVKRFPGATVLVAVCLVTACDKSPVTWRDDARQIPMPAAGDEGAVPADARLVLHADGSAALESIARTGSLPADTAACLASFRTSALSSTEIYSVWWSRRTGGRAALLSARSDDAGGTWSEPVPVDTTDRGTTACERPAPAIAADATSGYVHVTYFLTSPGGPGVFFSHSMERGELFHSPVPIMYGDRPAATAVAAADSVVIVAFEDPNSQRSQIAIAMSHTWGHIFSRERPEASVGTPVAERPLVALRAPLIAVGWHGNDRAVVARVGTIK